MVLNQDAYVSLVRYDHWTDVTPQTVKDMDELVVRATPASLNDEGVWALSLPTYLVALASGWLATGGTDEEIKAYIVVAASPASARVKAEHAARNGYSDDNVVPLSPAMFYRLGTKAFFHCVLDAGMRNQLIQREDFNISMLKARNSYIAAPLEEAGINFDCLTSIDWRFKLAENWHELTLEQVLEKEREKLKRWGEKGCFGASTEELPSGSQRGAFHQLTPSYPSSEGVDEIDEKVNHHKDGEDSKAKDNQE